MPRNPGFLEKVIARALERARLFCATAAFILREPQLFFVRYFSYADTGASRLPPSGGESFPYMKPFPFLGHAIGISAVVLPLTQLAILDLVRQDSHMFSPGFEDMLREVRAQAVGGIDFNALTGIPFLDSALAGAARYVAYFLFGVLFSVMAQRQVTGKASARCFAYLVAVALTAGAVLQGIAALVQLTVGLGLQSYMVLDFLTETARAAYVLGLPILVLPAALKVERPVVVKATLWALGIWFAAQLLFQLVQLAIGVPIRNFGLGLWGFL